MTIQNEDIDNFFVLATESYNIRDLQGKDVLNIYRGQLFKWLKKDIDMESDLCYNCSNVIEYHYITSYWNCDKDFQDETGNTVNYKVPSYVFIETYDVSDAEQICESWIDEISGSNKELFTPPHLRDEYKDWDGEKTSTNSN